jgi:hypothetical protein
MKNINSYTLALTVLLCIIFTNVKSQFINCDKFCVTAITLDTVPGFLNVTIFNGDTVHVNYPTIQVIDANGDTVGNAAGMFYFFAHPAGDTVTHTVPTTLTTLPTNFIGTVLLTDQVWDTTCVFPWPMNCTVSLEETTVINSFTIVPNPARDYFSVAGNFTNLIEKIIVRDVVGTITSITGNQKTFPLDNLPAGIYFVEIILPGKSQVLKLIKSSNR